MTTMREMLTEAGLDWDSVESMQVYNPRAR